MVKTLLSIFISLALLVGAAVFETFYVGAQFDKFGDALEALEIKVRDESATRGDAEAVRELWETTCTPLSRTTTSPISTTGWARR